MPFTNLIVEYKVDYILCLLGTCHFEYNWNLRPLEAWINFKDHKCWKKKFMLSFSLTMFNFAFDEYVFKQSLAVLGSRKAPEEHSFSLQAVAWIFLGIFSLVRFQADYLLVVGVCMTLSIANIVGFTRCRKGVQRYKFPKLEIEFSIWAVFVAVIVYILYFTVMWVSPFGT